MSCPDANANFSTIQRFSTKSRTKTAQVKINKIMANQRQQQNFMFCDGDKKAHTQLEQKKNKQNK